MNRGIKKRCSVVGWMLLLILMIAVCPTGAEEVSASEPQQVRMEENFMPELIPGENGTLQVTLACMNEAGQDIALAGETLGVYQVAELTVHGGAAVYSLTDAFMDTGISFEGMNASESNEAAAVMNMWADKYAVSGVQAVTDERGNAIFESLEPGMYLVRQEEYQETESGYLEMAPYLVMVPAIAETDGGKTWDYSVRTVPKVDIQEKDEPQNGRIEVTKCVTRKTEDGTEEIVAEDVTFYVGLFTDPEGTQLYDSAYIRPVHLTGASSAAIVFENLPYGEYYLFETDVAGKALPVGVAIENGEMIYICLIDEQKIVLDSENAIVQKQINNCYVELPEDEYNESESESDLEYESESEESEMIPEESETDSTEAETLQTERETASGEPVTEESVRTGDDTELTGYLIMMLLAAVILAVESRRRMAK